MEVRGLLRLIPVLAASVVWIVALDGARVASAGTPPGAIDRDTDGDGLPDFQEINRYCTDPTKKDTAGEGVPDGEGKKQREFTYSVRAVIRVMPPYKLNAFNDDYQDVRILSETGHLFLHGDEWFEDAGNYLQYRLFIHRAGRNVVLRAEKLPDVKCQLSLLYVTSASQNVCEIELIIPASDYARMAKGVAYPLEPINAGMEYCWRVKDELTITRTQFTREERVDDILERLERLEKRIDAPEKKQTS